MFSKYLYSIILFLFNGTSETEPKDAGSEKSSGVVRLNTIRQIIEQVINNQNVLHSFVWHKCCTYYQ